MSAGATVSAADLAALRAEIMRSLPRRPDPAFAAYHLSLCGAQLAALVALAGFLPAGLAWRVLYVLAMGLTQYRLYFLLHEACHSSLLRSAGANRALGRVLAGLLFTPFSAFTTVHMEHHRLYGRSEDPGAMDYYVHFDDRRELALFFLSPLLGLSLARKLWINVREVRTRWRARLRPRAGEPALSAWVPPLDAAVVFAVQGAMFLAITGFGRRPLDYAALYLLPGMTVFLFLARLRMYLEHGPVDYSVSDYRAANRRRIARTHDSPFWERPLFSYMNFEYHWEHHLVPSLPSSRLPEVHRRFTRSLLDPDDYSPSYSATLARILRLASRR